MLKVKPRKKKWTPNAPERWYAVWLTDVHDENGAQVIDDVVRGGKAKKQKKQKENWHPLGVKIETKYQAVEACNEIAGMLAEGLDPRSGGVTLEKWIDDYLDWCVGRKSANTIHRERRVLKVWHTWMRKKVPGVNTPKDIQPEHIERYQTERLNSMRMVSAKKDVSATFKASDGKKVSARTANLELAVLRYLCGNYSMRPTKRILSQDPTAGIERVDEARPATRAIPVEDLQKVEYALQGKTRSGSVHALAFRMILETGMRAGECFNIRWRDVDFAKQRVVIDNTDSHKTKTKDTRTVAISPFVVTRLHQVGAGKPDTLIFRATAKKRKLKTESEVFQNAFSLALRAACKKAAVAPFGMHALRHTAATMMLEKGAPIHWVMKVLGHKHLSTTQRYSHHTQEGMDAAISNLWRGDEQGRDQGSIEKVIPLSAHNHKRKNS